MRVKRLKVLMIVAVGVLILFGFWLGRHLRERHKAAEREAQYQLVFAKYTSELKPGMSREQVEQHLQANGKRFKQMCCVANFRTSEPNT
jgi:predicted negative regulator of RcsB-dependent stress response